MSEGLPGRALLVSAIAALALLAWPWLLAVLARRGPARFAGVPLVTLDALRTAVRLGGRPGVVTLAAWTGRVAAAAILPLGSTWCAADLDAGLLWLVALALGSLAVAADGATAAAASGVVTFGLCLVPPILRAATLQLGDLAIAQQGGVGNWFLVRDPFLLGTGVVYLVAAAALWPPAPVRPAGPDGLLQVALRAGLPLVLAHLFVIAYLGGWWAFVPALDHAGWLHTIAKTLAVVMVLVALRRRAAWSAPRQLERRLPLLAMASCLGSALWFVASGAAR